MDKQIVWERFKKTVCKETGLKEEYFDQWETFEDYTDFLMENWKQMSQESVDKTARDMGIITKDETIVRQEDGSGIVMKKETLN